MSKLKKISWKEIDNDFKIYLVSNTGLIKSMPSGVLKKPTISPYGYFQVCISSKPKRRTLKVHRLVASAYISNPENKPAVNHKNGKKTDNRVENLEWVTEKENTIHKYKVLGTQMPKRRVKCITLNKEYESARQAGSELGLRYQSIYSVCNGSIKDLNGMKFKYSSKKDKLPNRIIKGNPNYNKWIKYKGVRMKHSDWARFLKIGQNLFCDTLKRKSFKEMYAFYTSKHNIKELPKT